MVTPAKSIRRPDVFGYIDLHLYLRDFYSYRKRTEKSFSYEVWSQEMGLKSRSFLRLVITGRRTLTDQVFPLFIQSLKLSDAEVDHVSLLFRYSTTQDRTLKESYGRQLISRWRAHIDEVYVDNPEEFLQDPIIPIVFTYFTRPQASSRVEAIAKTLELETSRVLRAIQSLTRIRLLLPEVDEVGEVQYQTAESYFKVPAMPGNDFIRKFHFDGFEQAVRAHDLPFAQRKYTSLLMTLNEEQMLTAQKQISDFARAVLAGLSLDEKDQKDQKKEPMDSKEKIYRLNLQFFPVSGEL